MNRLSSIFFFTVLTFQLHILSMASQSPSSTKNNVPVINAEELERSESANPDSQICKKKGAVPIYTIMAIGILKKSNRLIVVTTPDKQADQYVYDLPVDSLREDSKKLFLSATPKPVSKKWPTLHSDKLYTYLAVRGQFYNGFTATDNQSEYLFLNAQKASKQNGVLYDIDKNKVMEGLVYFGEDAKQVMISSTELNNFYAIRPKDDAIEICKYSFKGKTVMESFQQKNDSELVAPIGEFKKMCLEGEHSISISKTECKKNLDWKVMEGFVAKNSFYLFSRESVYIFDESIMKGDKPTNFTVVLYAEFILCDADVFNKKDKGTMVGIIIAVVLILLILLLCCLLFCVREVLRKRKKNSQKKNSKNAKISPRKNSKNSKNSQRKSSKNSKKSLGANRPSFASVRSAGTLAGAAKLSRVKMSSRRSVRSTGASQGGGKLSRNTSINRSMRSRGVSKGHVGQLTARMSLGKGGSALVTGHSMKRAQSGSRAKTRYSR